MIYSRLKCSLPTQTALRFFITRARAGKGAYSRVLVGWAIKATWRSADQYSGDLCVVIFLMSAAKL